MALKYYRLFILILLFTSVFSYTMDYNEDNSNLHELKFEDWPEDAKQATTIIAASQCSLSLVRELLQHIKEKFSPNIGETALLATVDECTTHPDGPAIIKEFAKKINLNHSSIFIPLLEAEATADETGDLRVLRALLESGANPDQKGILPSGELSPLSSCQIMKLLAYKRAQQPTSTQAKDRARFQDIANLLNVM